MSSPAAAPAVSVSLTPSLRRWLIAALVVGALARLPGVAWGVNWPDGFTIHHPDEYTHLIHAEALLDPMDPRLVPAYPRALAAHAAAPYLAWYALQGRFGGPRVHTPWTVGAGRLVAVAYGVAALLIVFTIGRDALGDARAGVLAAWLLALGGLHVTQSHFFLADAPAATWTILAVWLLWRDATRRDPDRLDALCGAAFATGAAFAFKLLVFAAPSLLYVALARGPRLGRAVYAAVFAIAGLVVPSLGFDGPAAFYRALAEGVNYPHEFDRVRSAAMYAVQLPAILSLPFLLTALGGTWLLAGRLRAATPMRRRQALVIFGLPPALGLAAILFKLDHFPRHFVFLLPWAAVAGGWALARLLDRLARSGGSPALALAPVALWMAAFVVDGERHFISDPRNDALRWIRVNVAEGRTLHWPGHRTPPGYLPARFPSDAPPDVLVVEMHAANHFVSGVNWRGSFPTNPREVFSGGSAERVAAFQALFRGSSDYDVAARFAPSYVMPEYRLADALVGDRSRSYISEVVIFLRRTSATPAAAPPAAGGS